MKIITLVGINNTKYLVSMLELLSEFSELTMETRLTDQGNIKIVYDDSQDIFEKYLVMNIDLHTKGNLVEYEGYQVITVGFNKKASITVSSVEGEEIVFCIQRDIDMVHGKIEPQELVFKGDFFAKGDILHNIFVFTTLLLIKEKEINNMKNYF